jgi:hypothetical protein
VVSLKFVLSVSPPISSVPNAQVSRSKLWADIGRTMGLEHGHAAISSQLKNAYNRIILPFETYYSTHVRPNTSSSGLKANSHAPSQTPTRTRNTRSTALASPNGQSSELSDTTRAKIKTSPPPAANPQTPTSSPLSEPPEDREGSPANASGPVFSSEEVNVRNGPSQPNGATPSGLSQPGMCSPILHPDFLLTLPRLIVDAIA